MRFIYIAEDCKMTDEELKALVASLAIDQKELTKKMAQTDEQIASLFVAQKQTDEQMKHTDDRLDKLRELIGNMGRNQGDVTEEFFYNSLAEQPHLGSIHFDDIAKIEQKRRGKTEEEYDIVMTNGNAIGIVEVKYKAHANDLEKLERKMRNFKKLFPVYENYKLYGAIASFHIYEEAKQEALKRGFFVLQRSGKVVHTECGENLRVM
jgi:predicted AAA+ superfamily ATPase